MKPTIKAALVGAVLTFFAMFSLSSLHTAKAQAAGLGGERYKVLDAQKYVMGAGDSEGLEEVLNRLGAEGWKVRATTIRQIILAK